MTDSVTNAALDRVTILVLGQDQPEYLARLAHVYPSRGLRWQSVDATSSADLATTLQQRVSELQTPFVMLALDSDFVLPGGLTAAVGLLESRCDYNAVHGYELGFQPGNASVAYYSRGSSSFQAADDAPRSRLEAYAKCGLQAWRSVCSRQSMSDVLSNVPAAVPLQDWLVSLSFEMIVRLRLNVIDHTSTLVEHNEVENNSVERSHRLAKLVGRIHEWDAQRSSYCEGDEGFASVRRFVHSQYAQEYSELLFTSHWSSVVSGPERLFEKRQYVAMPYYNAPLFAQLDILEFVMHAWPAGQMHGHRLEGVWVRVHELLQIQPSDTKESRQARYWQALAAYRFNLDVCRALLETLKDEAQSSSVEELEAWVGQLERLPFLDVEARLLRTPSGKLLSRMQHSIPSIEAAKRVGEYLQQHPSPEIALFILDNEDNNEHLQITLDSLSAVALANSRIVVLKKGALPAITLPDSPIHFVKINDDNQIAHLNHAIVQVSCEWIILLRAGDHICAGGIKRLQVELASAPLCLAVAADEVHRDADGRLVAIDRPGADLDLLRTRPDWMSHHWAIQKQAVLDAGGFAAEYGHGTEMDLLLRLVETHGIGCLQHMDDYLVIARHSRYEIGSGFIASLDRHFAVLGYSPHLSVENNRRIAINYRHPATPLVSMLVEASDDLKALEACLMSVIQRTRYPRYEVVVACPEHVYDRCVGLVSSMGAKVRLVRGQRDPALGVLLNSAALQASGEYLVLLSSTCSLITPAWIENLLNQAQRPEVGIVGGRVLSARSSVIHAGFELLGDGTYVSIFNGVSSDCSLPCLGWEEVRACQAVSSECLMIGKALFVTVGGLNEEDHADIELCRRVTDEGLLVLSTPSAQITAGRSLDDSEQRTEAQRRPAGTAEWKYRSVAHAPVEPRPWYDGL